MEKSCCTCKKEFQVEEKEKTWKKQCYECYKNFRGKKRIEKFPRSRYDDCYICHPSVTKEELDAWIKENKLEIGWGAEEYNPTKAKLWINYTNFD